MYVMLNPIISDLSKYTQRRIEDWALLGWKADRLEIVQPIDISLN